MMRAKYTRALREGRLLRNAKGHIVVPEVVKRGVVLAPRQPDLQSVTVRIITAREAMALLKDAFGPVPDA